MRPSDITDGNFASARPASHASMRPGITDGNASRDPDDASMRPSDITDGNRMPDPAVGLGRPIASMRPSDITDGNGPSRSPRRTVGCRLQCERSDAAPRNWEASATFGG